MQFQDPVLLELSCFIRKLKGLSQRNSFFVHLNAPSSSFEFGFRKFSEPFYGYFLDTDVIFHSFVRSFVTVFSKFDELSLFLFLKSL